MLFYKRKERGRDMGKNTVYFSHDANALSDIKITVMRSDYGLEGYRIILGNYRNVKKYRKL